MDLSRFIYCSLKNKSYGKESQDELLSITNISRMNNSRGYITGALLASPTHFFQILEGEFEKVASTMTRIREDVRHESVEMLQMMPVEQRNFGDWDMAVIDLKAPGGSLTADLLNRVHSGQRQFVSVLQVVAFKLVHAGTVNTHEVGHVGLPS